MTGGVGGRVARLLADQGVPLRLVVRDPALAPAIPGADVAVAAYGNADAVREALAAVDSLLFVSASEAPERVDEHRIVVEAAAEAGVGHVVYLSFLGAAPDAIFTFARTTGTANNTSGPEAWPTFSCATASTLTCCPTSSPTTA